ncbi:replication initiation negative regulator SeqA [Alteromonas lipolytica]|uniref:Negative modulator of initiation of replication n=1 Tax=Alteromonas lipolytica TaxID=1856405 RepID=A0A1E8FK08_9ALTE|nr:replication initiation negative regulator SeqA [Alteromonas lipolytica]OFI36086.1 replication initiation regulator SeqA [Alteromonas lipolytica]GGF71071.1 negative modulator of initiation of replication [Alteromonas lipolytica]
MKTIEIDDELYAYIASQTKHIGESASEILRRLLIDEPGVVTTVVTNSQQSPAAAPVAPAETVADAGVQEEVKTPVKAVAKPAPKAVPVAKAGPVVTAESGEALLSRVNKDALSMFDKRVDQFLFILQQVYLQHPADFAKVESIVGKNRKYFASSKEELLKSGSSTNPKAIPESGYWVVTNNNTAKKLAMLSQVLQILGYDDKVVETVSETFDS